MNAISVVEIALIIVNAIAWYWLGRSRTMRKVIKILMKYTDDICSVDPNALSSEEECVEQLGRIVVLNEITKEIDQEFFGKREKVKEDV